MREATTAGMEEDFDVSREELTLEWMRRSVIGVLLLGAGVLDAVFRPAWNYSSAFVSRIRAIVCAWSIGNTAAQEKKHASRHELYTVKQHAIQDRVLPQHATSHVRRMWRACIYCDGLFNRCCSDESSGGHLHNTFHRAPVAGGVCESCISAFMYFGNQFERNGGEMGSEFDIGRGLPSTPCLEEADTIEPTAKNRGAKAKRPSFDDQSFLHCFEGMDLHKIRQGSG